MGATRRRVMVLGLTLAAASISRAANKQPERIPAAEDDDHPAPAHLIVCQKGISDNACGPCAVLNSLTWGNSALAKISQDLPGKTGDDKVKGLIAIVGSKPSRSYPGKLSYDPDTGMSPQDLVRFTNEVLSAHAEAPVKGAFLDLKDSETSRQHVRRIYQILKTSLDGGFPPIISLRSFAAKDMGEKKGYAWDGLQNHFVPVVKLADMNGDVDMGFTFEYLDSESGQIKQGYIYAETVRKFTAARGNAQTYEWLSGFPFLMAVTPTLKLNTSDVPWYDRTTIVLNYAVYRPAKEKQD